MCWDTEVKNEKIRPDNNLQVNQHYYLYRFGTTWRGGYFMTEGHEFESQGIKMHMDKSVC